MAATHTPQADKIHWRRGSHLNGGASRFGEYPIAAGRGITFRRPGAAPEEVPARSGSDADVYRACVGHNKTLLGIPEFSSAIAHLRDVLGDQTYESLARKGGSMTTAEMATYAYDQIGQARTELEHPS